MRTAIILSLMLFTSTGALAQSRDGCDCGTTQQHTGVDWTAKAGSPVPVAADGVVVRIENDEQAPTYTATGGFCGRYIVVRHSNQGGSVVFTRYAQLGRIAGKNAAPLAVGSKVAKGDPIGAVGGKGLLHFEVRPLDERTANRSEAFKLIYSRDPSMEWARYQPVDPASFDFDKFRAVPAR